MTHTATRHHFLLSAVLTFSALLGATLVLPARASVITIDTVQVDNAGNAPDPLTGFGSVSYDYRIGTTEVTIGQYTAFLNAIAKTDTYGLYIANMETVVTIAGIKREGESGSYVYSAIGSPNKPVTYVTWGNAARFVNWLHNGQPTGTQNADTTETGAYTINGAIGNDPLLAVMRNDGAKWWIPSEDEWYKAAHHKNDGVTGNYWLYPTSSNDTPDSDQAPGSGAPNPSNTGNFYRVVSTDSGYNDGYAVTADTLQYSNLHNYLTDVGAYVDATSPYGTFDQAGNVAEWTDSIFANPLGFDAQAIRGGSWGTNLTNPASASNQLIATYRHGISPASYSGVGFRVATLAVPVPEPSTLLLSVLGMMGLTWRNKRRK